ncbi:hypothetical protein B0J14DRAFT_330818 [Halenospora varia]|nr:hypothetical protein B0J14DRAFT_330818 [Halenospora varia]
MHLISVALPTALLSLILVATATPTPQNALEPGIGDSNTSIEEDTGAVSINQAPISTNLDIPITAQFFAGAPGPKQCRGSSLGTINLPKPATQFLEPKCYNMPEPSSCAVFLAGKDDGCEAQLFDQPNCSGFLNLAVFLQELRPMGGRFQSISLRCGVVGVAPPPLNFPGMQMPAGVVQAQG